MANKTKIVNSAQKYLQRGAYDKAVKELQKLLEEDPRDVRTLLKIGDIYAKKGDRGEAIRVYRQVAEAYGDQGFFLKAVAVYKQILKHDPQHFEVTLKLAELYEHLGLMQEALAQYQLVAALHDQRGNTREWLAVLQRMVDLDPENVASRVRLAEGLSREHLVPDAVEQFAKAADILKRQARQSDYVKVAERLVYHDHSRLDVLKDLARIYLAQGDSKRAATKLKTCFEQAPKDVETLTLLGRAFRDVGHNGKAIYVYHQLARAHLEHNAQHEARLVYQTILELDPNDAEARRSLGMSAPAKPSLPPEQWMDASQMMAELTSDPAPAPIASAARQQPVTYAPGAQTTRGAATTSPPHEISISLPERRPATTTAPAPSGGAISSKNEKQGKEQIAKLLTETDVYVKYGLREKALEHLRRILELDPDAVDAYLKMRDLYVSARDPARAAESMAQAIRIYRQRGDDASAEAARIQLVTLAPGHPATLPGAILSARPDAFQEDADLDSIEIDVAGDEEEAQVEHRPAAIEERISAQRGMTDDLVVYHGMPASQVVDAEDLMIDSSSGVEIQASGSWPAASGWNEPSSSQVVGDEEIVASTDLPQGQAPIPQDFDASQSLLDSLDLGDSLPSVSPEEDDSGFGPLGTDVDGKKSLDYPMELAAIESLNEAELKELADDHRSLSSFKHDDASLDGDAELASILEGDQLIPDVSDLDAESDPEIDEELEAAEFLESQGLNDEARDSVLEILKKRPFYPRAIAMLDRVETALGMREEQATQRPTDEEAIAGLGAPVGQREVSGSDLVTDRRALEARETSQSEQITDSRAVEQQEQPAGPLSDADAERMLDTGYAYHQAAMYTEAVAAFENAASNAARAAEAIEMIGHCLNAQGDTVGAVTHFYRALELGAAQDRAPRLKYEIGIACEAAGEYDNALAWYAAAYADDPEQQHLRERIRNLGANPDLLATGEPANAASGANGAHSAARPASESRPQKKSKISYL